MGLRGLARIVETSGSPVSWRWSTASPGRKYWARVPSRKQLDRCFGGSIPHRPRWWRGHPLPDAERKHRTRLKALPVVAVATGALSARSISSKTTNFAAPSLRRCRALPSGPRPAVSVTFAPGR